MMGILKGIGIFAAVLLLSSCATCTESAEECSRRTRAFSDGLVALGKSLEQSQPVYSQPVTVQQSQPVTVQQSQPVTVKCVKPLGSGRVGYGPVVEFMGACPLLDGYRPVN